MSIHEDAIVGTLSTLDRMIFKGHLTGDEVSARIEVDLDPHLAAAGGGVQIETDPEIVTIGPGTESMVKIIVTNTGEKTETFDLSASLPPTISGTFQNSQLLVTPGLGAGRETILTLNVAAGTTAESLPYLITATLSDNPFVTDSAGGTLDVNDIGVQVSLSPQESELIPGQDVAFMAEVFNTGNVASTFDLNVLGPLAPFATLTPSCPDLDLDADEACLIDIQLSDTTRLLQQRTILAVQAFSVEVPEISDVAASAIDVAPYREMNISLEPTQLTIDVGEVGQFQLRISNLGNACDERYVMEFSSLPSDISITPQTTSFLVPPLKTAVLNLDAITENAGTYDVSVSVLTAIDNTLCPTLPAIEATIEATLCTTAIAPNDVAVIRRLR
ncbi:MAG: hypothetical protein GY764_11035 [Halieaceae bacterium]|nr:hypothetical protein [Halieaceae bacterium]